jgi:lipoprotein-anchoring transpeptidase ErfK/SrfK
MHCVSLVMAALVVGLSAFPASSTILIEVDKATQRMSVTRDGERLYAWPVSTGARGYDTPSGEFSAISMARQHFSREWDDAPMPHSIFFTKRGHAIHGTEHTRNIGRAASHGCVRLEPENARLLFEMVKAEGIANVRVVLTGETASGGLTLARRASRRPYSSRSPALLYGHTYRAPAPFFSSYGWW